MEIKAIRLTNLKVVYLNGDKAADQYSRDINLGAEGKSIRSVEFQYRTTGNILKGRGDVLLFGKKYVASIEPK